MMPVQHDLIMRSLKYMLDELNQDEMNSLEDFIVNFCDESYVDEDGNKPNIFRMILA